MLQQKKKNNNNNKYLLKNWFRFFASFGNFSRLHGFWIDFKNLFKKNDGLWD
jgi:hypothetical protein